MQLTDQCSYNFKVIIHVLQRVRRDIQAAACAGWLTGNVPSRAAPSVLSSPMELSVPFCESCRAAVLTASLHDLSTTANDYRRRELDQATKYLIPLPCLISFGPWLIENRTQFDLRRQTSSRFVIRTSVYLSIGFITNVPKWYTYSRHVKRKYNLARLTVSLERSISTPTSVARTFEVASRRTICRRMWMTLSRTKSAS